MQIRFELLKLNLAYLDVQNWPGWKSCIVFNRNFIGHLFEKYSKIADLITIRVLNSILSRAQVEIESQIWIGLLKLVIQKSYFELGSIFPATSI